MKTLIAGFGSIGRRHLSNLRALGETDFLLLRSRRSTLPEDEIAGIPVETDIEAALAHKPDAVIISNPTALHLDIAIPSAAAGCAVLMEKPISNNFERIKELKESLLSGHGKLLMGFQFRFHPTLNTIRLWIAQNKIGTPISVRAHWGEYLPGWHPWEDYRKGYSARTDLGGGVVHTLSHPLDYLHGIFGDVELLSAFTSCRGGLDLEVEDTAEIMLRFKSGVVGSIHLDYIQRPPKHTLAIVGSKGTILWDNADGIARMYDTEKEIWELSSPPFGFERNTMFLSEMRHFIAVAQGSEKPQCTLEDGIAALKLALAVHESAAHNGGIVEIPHFLEKNA